MIRNLGSFVMMLSLLLFLLDDVTAKKLPECEHWVCVIPQECMPSPSSGYKIVSEAHEISDNCHAIMKIKPYSSSHWRMILESWSSDVSALKLREEFRPKISCSKTGDICECTSTLTEFENDKKYSELPLHCEMIFGHSHGDKVQLFLTSNYVELSTNDPRMPILYAESAILATQVADHIFCDMYTILFTNDTESGKEFQQVDASKNAKDVTCSGSNFALQYLNEQTYVPATSIKCEKFEHNLFNYVIEMEYGEIVEERGEFKARCARLNCNRCFKPYPVNGKIAPTLTSAAGVCDKLTCPNGFRITKTASAISIKTAESAICSKVADNYYWKVGDMILDETVQVDCVDAKCRALTHDWCTEGCYLDPIEVKPRCSTNYELIGHFDNISPKEIEVICDLKRSTWQYYDNGELFDLPSTVYLTCLSDQAPIKEQGVPSTIQFLLVVLGMSMAFLVAAAFIVFK